MKTYPIPMVPGPVTVPEEILNACRIDYGAADLEPDFLDCHAETAAGLQRVLGTRSQVVIATGEGMLALWSALKSCLVPGDRVVSVATGVFGDGIAEMAKAIGADVRTVGLPYDQTLGDLADVEAAVAEHRPKMITAVHCETPSGTLNPMADLGALKARYGVPLLYVDAVSSAGGTPVAADEWGIDLALGGSQKCLSAPPGMAFLSVSEAAWEAIEAVDYVGYDALKPFRTAPLTGYFPYTPFWQGVAALRVAVRWILDEGLEAVFERHERVAADCRRRLAEMGLSLFPAPGAISSPTVTAVKVPEGITWETLDARLRERGLVVGGSYGPMAGRIFRLGHMGSQADPTRLDQALDVLAAVTAELG